MTPTDPARGPQVTVSVGIILPGLSRVAAGGYKVAYAYANSLAEFGHDVTVYHSPTLEGWYRRRSLSLRENASDRVRHYPSLGIRPSWYRLNNTVHVRNAYHLTSQEVRIHDIVVATSAETAPLAARASAHQSTAGAYFIQHYEDWAGKDEVRATWDLPLRHIVIAPWLHRISATHGQEAILVPNAIDTTEFSLGGPISSREFDVVALVSDKAFKRTDLIIQLLNGLAASRPGFRACTFGTVPRPAGLAPTIGHYPSPTPEDLRTLYQTSRIYVCASDAEGWHLPPAEAMASGCAVVSTSIPGVQAYAEDIALFAPRGDFLALQRRVETLLDDPSDCQRRATLGASRMRQYSPTDSARSFEQALLQTIRERQ